MQTVQLCAKCISKKSVTTVLHLVQQNIKYNTEK